MCPSMFSRVVRWCRWAVTQGRLNTVEGYQGCQHLLLWAKKNCQPLLHDLQQARHVHSSDQTEGMRVSMGWHLLVGPLLTEAVCGVGSAVNLLSLYLHQSGWNAFPAISNLTDWYEFVVLWWSSVPNFFLFIVSSNYKQTFCVSCNLLCLQC